MIDLVVQEGARRLEAFSESPQRDAELLLAHVLGQSRTELFVRRHDTLTAAAAQAYEQLVAQRERGVPVAYLLGYREFWNSRFSVSPDVLIPRPDTEVLVETALSWLAGLRAPRVLDLGTGSGAIGLSLALERPDAEVDLVDVCPAALAVAAQNREALNVANARTVLGNWFEPLDGRTYHLVVANPPYVAPDDPHLPALRHEPRGALVAADGGLADLRRIVADAPDHLLLGGRLLLEHGYNQAPAVRDCLAASGWTGIQTFRDLGGIERATGATRRD